LAKSALHRMRREVPAEVTGAVTGDVDSSAVSYDYEEGNQSNESSNATDTVKSTEQPEVPAEVGNSK